MTPQAFGDGAALEIWYNESSRLRTTLMVHHGINFDSEELAAFCQRHRIHTLSLFGSVLREDFGPESDIDVLVEFEPDARVGLITFAGIEIELSEILGRKVNLNTPGCLSKYFRDEVLAEAEVQYVAASESILEPNAPQPS